VIGVPIRDGQGKPVGALIILGDAKLARRDDAMGFIRAAAGPLATCLTLLRKKRAGAIPACLGRVASSACRWRWRVVLGVLVVLGCLLAVPFPHRVGCDCEIQPVTRRYVVAPYEGILAKTLVEPGDVVAEGELLARMDGREIRWELAGLQAEYDQAAKRRDAAMAGHRVAAAQLAALEMERLRVKMQVLQNRNENLNITSPIPGIVITGDLKQVEGAPLERGQALYEIAPLGEMILELAVPEHQISYVREGQEVTIRLNAYPGEKWEGTIAKIHPKSEIRDNEAAFVAEVRQENVSRRLRPGMRGEAQVASSNRALGWILFHRPLEVVAAKLGW
jgi:biotin carboxyl carrier protein